MVADRTGVGARGGEKDEVVGGGVFAVGGELESAPGEGPKNDEAYSSNSSSIENFCSCTKTSVHMRQMSESTERGQRRVSERDRTYPNVNRSL